MKTKYLSCNSGNCRKTFRNESSLQKHLSEDHSECENNSIIGYRCKKCKRVLGSQQSLKEHFYTHTGQKPYKCNEPGCGKYFRQSSQLSYHRRIHMEVKKYLKQNPEAMNDSEGCQGNDQVYQLLGMRSPIELPDLPQIGNLQVGVKLPNIFEGY